MKLASTVVLALLVLLALASGVTKIALMPDDVDFFGRYGFSNAILMAYGATQVAGGVLLPFRKTRFLGAAILAITFLVSLVVLVMDGNVPVSIATMVATLLLGMVMKQSWNASPADP